MQGRKEAPQTGAIHWPSRIGSWLVLLLATLVAVFLIGTWVDALARFLAPDTHPDPALANEATLAPGAFSGLFLVSAAVATIPLGAGLCGLWHLYRQLGERGVGRRLGFGRRLLTFGAALVAASILLAGSTLMFQPGAATSLGLPILPAHLAILAVGLVTAAIGVWRAGRIS